MELPIELIDNIINYFVKTNDLTTIIDIIEANKQYSSISRDIDEYNSLWWHSLINKIRPMTNFIEYFIKLYPSWVLSNLEQQFKSIGQKLYLNMAIYYITLIDNLSESRISKTTLTRILLEPIERPSRLEEKVKEYIADYKNLLEYFYDSYQASGGIKEFNV